MLKIRALESGDLEAVRRFTDHEIGAGYYSADELAAIYRKSAKNGIMCSLVLVDEHNQISGIRISYPPGQWDTGKGRGLMPGQWPYPISETGYFQSIFLSAALQGKGWGGQLSEMALSRLCEVGARGVVCHSWKESPHNSSTRYLLKLGFQVIAEYPNYWKDVAYNCARCLKPPCLCTAQEMYLNLEKES